MLPRVREARHLSGYIVWVRFDDGAEGEIDLSSELHGEIFEPLMAVEYFKALHFHPELHTIVWPMVRTSRLNFFAQRSEETTLLLL